MDRNFTENSAKFIFQSFEVNNPVVKIARSLKTYPELEHIDSEPPSTSQFLDKDLDQC